MNVYSVNERCVAPERKRLKNINKSYGTPPESSLVSLASTFFHHDFWQIDIF